MPSLQPMQRMVIEAYEKVVTKNISPFATPVVVGIGCSEKWCNCQINTCPTITKNRAATFGYWVYTKGAPISIKDMTLFQGFDADDVDWAGVGVTASQFVGRLEEYSVLECGGCRPAAFVVQGRGDHQEAVQVDKALTRL